MPYSTTSSRRSFTFDKLLELYDRQLPAIAATTSSTPYNAGANTEGTGITTQKYLTARVQFNKYSGYAAGTVQWSATIEASSAIAGTYVPVGGAVLNPEDSELIAEISFSGIQLCKIIGIEPGVGTPAFLRVTFTLTGLAGTLSPGCDLGCY